MITVIEVWHLKPEFKDRALELMQVMDDLVEPGAHENPGWCAHAHFFQDSEIPERVLMVYPWHDRDSHAQLAEREEPMLQIFYSDYCTKHRDIQYYTELPVEHADF